MLKLFNTMGRKLEVFRPVNRKVVNMFTCGPSVYQRSHIGNFRTFLFEDILVRYLEYRGYKVLRGMNFTDVEDKAYKAAREEKTAMRQLTERNIRAFCREMTLLRMQTPDYLPRASEHVDRAVDIIQQLLKKGIAYWYRGNVYFDPLKFSGFGKLYGLDMSRWPKRKVRFHKDTYPGMRWNLGDFILWHGASNGAWDTAIGRGRPSWNIQDPSMVSDYFDETLSIYCGGIDNLFRHHDYSIAILESVRPYPMARFWLHCHHLHVNGKKMSKSIGNIIYTDTLKKQGYSLSEIRFFLIYGHYRSLLNFSAEAMRSTAEKLRALKKQIRSIERKTKKRTSKTGEPGNRIEKVFRGKMDNDLNVKAAFDGIYDMVMSIDSAALKQSEAAGIIAALKNIDEVLRVMF
ncbi:MAG: class I tRNA ligase family protein [Nitrospirota bacterium]